MSLVLLGIDWADAKHDACLMDAAGQVMDEFVVTHDRSGLEILGDKVRAVAVGCEVLCALETNHGLLVNFLLDQDWTVYAINPKAVDRYRDRTRTARAKSDRLDAWLLADILRTDRHLHRPLLPVSEGVRELRELTRDRESLTQECTRLVNQLKATLKAYWPESLGLFPELDRPWAMAFLEKYPTREAASDASLEELRAFLRGCRHPRWHDKSEQLRAALREPYIQVAPYLTRTKSRQMRHFVSQLRQAVDDRRSYDEEIERLLSEQADANLFLSLPGAGTNLAARFVAEIGDDRSRYSTANGLQCDAGTAPVTKQSGKSLKVVRFRHACKKQLRQTFQLFAGCSLPRCNWAKALYFEQRSRGKCHQEALRMVANRWAKIIFAMWKTRTEYDESRYLQAKDQRAAA